MTDLPTGTVTFLFSDLEGSTRLLQELGDGFDDVLVELFDLQRAAISLAGGVEVRTEGDMVFAAFDSAVAGVLGAAEAQRALDSHEWPGGVEVRVRIGLHTGEGRLAGPDYVGIDVHRAARISAAGHGGQVLISDATRALVAQDLPDGVGLRELGEHRFKDLESPMRVFQLKVDGLPIQFPEIRSVDARPNNLPSQLTSFVGRVRELDEVTELVSDHRLVTLTGPGGSGKSRLALRVSAELMERFSDGVFFVDLAPLADVELVSSTVAQALDLAVDPGGDPLVALKHHLENRDLLLVLDNFEQVIDGAEVVEGLLGAAPKLRVLVTSRMPLRLYGEQEFEVPPLAVPDVDEPYDELFRSDAVALFVERAREVEPGFDPSDELKAIAGIAARVDGLPLAIELAASRIRIMPPETILARLEDSLSLLATSARDRPERQRTLRGAIDWSYDLLEPWERRLFARLSVFPGGCSEEAAERVCGEDNLEIPFLDRLEALVEQSLVRSKADAGRGVRFRMLETVRQYAGERLVEDFDYVDTNRRLGEFFMDFVEQADTQSARDQREWFDRFESEKPNLRAVMRWAVEAGEPDVGLRTATALWRFWQLRGPFSEGRELLRQLLAIPGSSRGVRAQALNAAGDLAWWDGDYDACKQYHEGALPLYREVGDRQGEVDGLFHHALLTAFAGQVDSAQRAGTEEPMDSADNAETMLNQALELAEQLGYALGAARARVGLGLVMVVARGQPAAAMQMFQESFAEFDDLGDPWDMTWSRVNLGNAYRLTGEREQGRAMFLEAIKLMNEAGNGQTLTGLLMLVAAVDSELGRHERAVRLWSAAQSARRLMGALQPPTARRLMGDPVGAARAAIGDEAVDNALAEGETMDLDQAIGYASGHS